MKWSLEWGKHIKFLKSIKTDKVPTALATEPMLTADTIPYVTAFSILSSSHQVHAGVIQAIPLTEMEAYCRLFDVEDIELFVRVIHAADQAYLEHYAGKQK